MQREMNYMQKRTSKEKLNTAVGLMLLGMEDEDLEKLDKYPRDQANKWLEIMVSKPKNEWKGLPDFLMKYEIEDEDDW
jgi:hypothetical protein